MCLELQEVAEFKNDQQFSEIKQAIYRLVAKGLLRECGLDPSDPWHLVEVFESQDGGEWHLANPDHAYRGYLRKVR